MPIIQRLGSASARGFGFGKTGVTHQRVVQESATITDATNRAVSYDSVISETSTAADAIASLLNSLNQVLETATGSDLIEGDRGFVSTINETATISELISTIGDQNVAVAETSIATDTVSIIGTYNSTALETGSIADTPQQAVLTTNDIAESGTASDDVTPIRTTPGVIVEVALGEDEVDRFPISNGIVNESASITDISTTNVTQLNIISETATITDSVVGTKNYWITRLTETTNTVELQSVTVDLSGNVYVTGMADTSSIYNGVLVMKYNNFGTLLWQRILETVSVSETGYGITVDNSGNVYICADIGSGSTTTGRVTALIKYDTNGNLLFQSHYRYGTTISTILFPNGIALDASQAYVYTVGTNYAGAGMTLVKHNTSGTLQWMQTVAVAGPEAGTGLKIDASGNILVAGVLGTNFSGNNYYFGGLVKLDPSGAVLNTVRLTGDDTYFVGVATDSSGNIYCVGYDDYVSGASAWLLLFKFDSSFNLLWTKQLSRSGIASPDAYSSIVIDSDDNIFITGYLGSYDPDRQIIVRYDVSGNLIWQRYISTSQSLISTYGQLYVDATSIYLTTKESSGYPYGSFIFKLPKDGSLTGTYVVGDTTVTYGVETLTEATPLYGTTVPTVTNTNRVCTTSAGGATSFASPVTSVTVNI